MNIASCINSPFVRPLKVLLYSLADTQEEQIDFYLVYRNLEKCEVDDLKRFSNAIGINLIPIVFPEDIYSQIQECHKFNEYGYPCSIEWYFRLFFASILPQDVTKVIYLDSDIYVQKNLGLFYEKVYTDYFFVGVQDPACLVDSLNNLKEKFFNKIGKPSEGNCFINSGVLMMNLALMRKYQIFQIEDMLHLINSNEKFNDQEIINSFFYDKIFVLDDIKYNLNPSFFNSDDAYIIHYMQNKPWWELGNNSSLKATLKWRHSEKWVHIIDSILNKGEK